MTRVRPSSLRAAFHVARTSHDDAVDEQEHADGEQDVDPTGSRRGESDERPDGKHQNGGDYPEIHGEISLTLSVTTGKFNQSFEQLFQKNLQHHRWGGELTF